jgi:uncharacterized membrane-anchored protein
MMTLRILIVAIVQTLALGYMIVDRQAMLNASRVVTLKIVPVDPRDMFRGDYVILSYDISTLDTAKLDGEDKFNHGDTVYVTLTRTETAWGAVAIARRPVPVQGGIALKGTIRVANDQTGGETTTQTLNVDYGIESYFVPEGTGHAIENEARSGDLSADIAVDGDGRGAIKALRRKGGEIFYVEGIL